MFAPPVRRRRSPRPPLSLTELLAALLAQWRPGVEFDVERVSCLRSCPLGPAHRDWLDAIWQRLQQALAQEQAADWH